MGNVIRENIAPLNDKLTVTISKDDYLPSFEKSLKEYAKKANIPGFRKGMVPAGVLKKMYGQSLFTEEVYKTLEKQLNDYLDNEQIDYFWQPIPLEKDLRMQFDVNHPLDYSFQFEVGLRPAVKIDLSNIHVTRYKPVISAQLVDEEVDRLQIRHSTVAYQEAVDSNDNILTLRFTEVDAEGNPVEDGITKVVTMLIKYFKEPLRKQWIGKKQDESLTIQLSTAFEEKEKEWVMTDLGLDKTSHADADKFFKLTITRVVTLQKAPLDTVFFDKVYPGKEITTPEDFKSAVKGEIENYYHSQSSLQVQDQIYHRLLEDTDIPLPEDFLKRWLKLDAEKNNTGEDAELEFPKMKRQLKWSLISSSLLKENKVTVEQSEIKEVAKQQISNYMSNYGTEDIPWIDEYANRMMKDKKFVEETYQELRTSKIFDLLETLVHETEESISLEDFAAKLHHHHH